MTVPCKTLGWQVAQKLHASTAALPAPKTNDGAHDLVDLQLLEGLLPAGPRRRPSGLRRALRGRCIGVVDVDSGRGEPLQLATEHPRAERAALWVLGHE